VLLPPPPSPDKPGMGVGGCVGTIWKLPSVEEDPPAAEAASAALRAFWRALLMDAADFSPSCRGGFAAAFTVAARSAMSASTAALSAVAHSSKDLADGGGGGAGAALAAALGMGFGCAVTAHEGGPCCFWAATTLGLQGL